MSIVPPNAYITPASPVVVDQITRLNAKADRLDNRALAGISELMSFNVENIPLDPRIIFSEEELEALLAQLGDLPEFDPNTDWTAGLSLSAGDENFAFNPALFQHLTQMLPDADIPPLGAMPAAPTAPPSPGEPGEIAPPPRPTLPQYNAPDVDLDAAPPAYEDFTAGVPFPTLREIVLPPAPVIDTDDIAFEGVRPIFDATAPDPQDFAFENANYAPQLIEQTRAKVLEIFNGGVGLPAAVENAMFERVRERETELGERGVEQARDEWSARGWKRPPGMLAAAEYRARRDASDKVSAANREQFVQHHQARLEMLRSALSTAMTLEEVWSRLHMSAEDRRLQAAKMRLDLQVQVFNALVSRFQAEGQMFAIDAQVYSEKFRAAQVKLQLFGEQLRAQQLIGEINAQDVDIYAKRIGALEINAQIYRARIEGFRALYEAVEAKVNVYRGQLESNKQLLDGYETDVRAFGEQLRAQAARDDRFKIRSEIYATDMGAWRTQFDVLLAEQERHFKTADVKRDTFVSNTQRVSAFIDAESGRISALRDKYAALASEIDAKAQVERSRYQLMLAIAQARMGRYTAAAEILMKNGEISIQNLLTAEGLALRAQETATTTLAQMAAGYTSAANVNASISDSSGSSISYSFNGELEVN